MPNKPNAISPGPSLTAATPGPAHSGHPLPGDVGPPTVDYRLVIEPGPRPGTYVYKTVDRSTGETIKQLPREEVIKLIDDPRYATGTIADTSA